MRLWLLSLVERYKGFIVFFVKNFSWSLAAVYYSVIVLLYNIYSILYYFMLGVFYLPSFLLDVVLVIFLKIVSFYYIISINFYRKTHNNFFLRILVNFLTLFFGVLFFFELLYLFSPFVAKGIIYFYNPFNLFFGISFNYYIIAFCIF